MHQIIALGGGGFSEERSPYLENYVLSQARVEKPAVAFIATASGDAESYLLKFYRAFSSLPCRPSHLPLFHRTPDIRRYLLDQDVIYVGGGNTKSMLAVWRDWDLPAFLRDALLGGTVLAGVSAGAICWFDEGLTDSRSSGFEPLRCLGFLSGSCCPHYSNEPERPERYKSLIGNGSMSPGIAIDDDAGVHLIDGVPHRVIASRRGATAYRVELDRNGDATEQPLPVEHLVAVA